MHRVRLWRDIRPTGRSSGRCPIQRRWEGRSQPTSRATGSGPRPPRPDRSTIHGSIHCRTGNRRKPRRNALRHRSPPRPHRAPAHCWQHQSSARSVRRPAPARRVRAAIARSHSHRRHYCRGHTARSPCGRQPYARRSRPRRARHAASVRRYWSRRRSAPAPPPASGRRSAPGQSFGAPASYSRVGSR